MNSTPPPPRGAQSHGKLVRVLTLREDRTQVRQSTTFGINVQVGVTLVNLFVVVAADLPAHISRHIGHSPRMEERGAFSLSRAIRERKAQPPVLRMQWVRWDL